MSVSVEKLRGVPAKVARGSAALAEDCRGQNFFEVDHGLRNLLDLYMPDDLKSHMWPHYESLGELAGGRLDELADIAERHPPKLHYRNRWGADEDWVEYHPAYHEMEKIAFQDYGLHAMSHRAGVLDWPEKIPPIAKYAFTYLFVQAEFGIMCPISVTDTSMEILLKFADEDLQRRYIDKMLLTDRETMLRGTQFMTEKRGGSDVGLLETEAVHDGKDWRLYGEKWFCSHVDADVAMILARPEGAPEGTKGIGLFLLPRTLPDGTRNAYRVKRLKPKMGTNSMASGEIVLEGAVAYPVGDLEHGLKHMMVQVNLSRLSHGVRAASMMRRCYNEALAVARSRIAFGGELIDKPLVRRQLLKIQVPTEQALSMYAYTADQLGRAKEGDKVADERVRILTPLYKFRACRDNPGVATASMEMRGGNGYIEDYINPRLVRDAQIGLLWEGTSNINGLDVVTRAVAKVHAHKPVIEDLTERLNGSNAVPPELRDRAVTTLDRVGAMAEDVAKRGDEAQVRKVSSAMYHAITAALMAWEGATLGARGGDARRLLLARMVLDHRLSASDPLAVEDDRFDQAAAALLIDDMPVPLAKALEVLAM